MARRGFGSVTQQEPVPPESVAAAVEVQNSGRLQRHYLSTGETGEVGRLEPDCELIAALICELVRGVLHEPARHGVLGGMGCCDPLSSSSRDRSRRLRIA